MIVVYSKAQCPNCNALYSLLDEEEIEYTKVKIDEDEIAREFIVSQGLRSVPQLFKDGKLIGGYQEVLSVWRKGELK